MTLSGIEPATTRLVAKCINQLCHCDSKDITQIKLNSLALSVPRLVPSTSRPHNRFSPVYVLKSSLSDSGMSLKICLVLKFNSFVIKNNVFCDMTMCKLLITYRLFRLIFSPHHHIFPRRVRRAMNLLHEIIIIIIIIIKSIVPSRSIGCL